MREEDGEEKEWKWQEKESEENGTTKYTQCIEVDMLRAWKEKKWSENFILERSSNNPLKNIPTCALLYIQAQASVLECGSHHQQEITKK